MEKIQRFLLISTAIGMVLSVLYLFGFWSAFDVNILNYITLADVLKYGLFPIAIFIFLVILIFIPLIILEGVSSNREVKSSLEVDSKKIRNRLYCFLAFVLFIIVLYIFGIVEFMSITMSVALGVTFVLMDLPLFMKKIPNLPYRFSIIAMSLVVVFNTSPMGYKVAELRKK